MPAFQTSDGRTLSYRLAGSGPPLVCHPGGPGFSSRYFGELSGLASDRTLVLLNPRGTGDSGRPAHRGDYRFEDYAADLDELRAHLELETIDLVGHSHGGCVAIEYAAAYRRVGRLVLASTLARFATDQHEAMEAGMRAREGEPWYEDACAALAAEHAGEFASDLELAQLALREFPLYFAHYGEREADYLEVLGGEIPNADALLLFNREILLSFDLRPTLARITAPTLVVTGQEDFITGPVCARELAEGIADVTLAILPRAGHFVFAEQPERFREVVLGFLRGG